MKTGLLALTVLATCFYLSWNLGVGANAPPEPQQNPVSVGTIVGGSAAIYHERCN